MKKLLLLAARPPLPRFRPAGRRRRRRRRCATPRSTATRSPGTSLEGLTTEVGQRLAGTEAEARARDWAVRRLTALGFSNVRVEPFDMPVWVRGEERAEIVSPFPQPLVVTALGNSGATPARGHRGRGRRLRQRRRAAGRARRGGARQDRLRHPRHAADPGRLGLRPVRRAAPARARPSPAARARRRSSSARSAPTITATRIPACRTSPTASRPIPAGALSIPDAEQLQRILARAGGRPVRMRLTLTPRNIGRRQSGNVVAEVPGSDPDAGVIADRRPSRQLGPRHRRDRQCGGRRDHHRRGAPDHAGGPAAPDDPGRPVRRRGGRRRSAATTHFDRHQADGNVVLVGESDFGADRVWRVNFNLGAGQCRRSADRIAALLAPLGIVRGREPRQCRRRPRRLGARGHRRDRPQPGRHPLFRLSPHARRHARQGRSGAAPAERRRLDGDAGRGGQRAGARSSRRARRRVKPCPS